MIKIRFNNGAAFEYPGATSVNATQHGLALTRPDGAGHKNVAFIPYTSGAIVEYETQEVRYLPPDAPPDRELGAGAAI